MSTKGLTPEMMSGIPFKGNNPNKIGVTYGPNNNKQDMDPVDVLLKKTNGDFNFEPNGLVRHNIKNNPDTGSFLDI